MRSHAEILWTEGLEVRYANGVHALAPTSLRIERGSFVVLLGSSGAGKSTLLRCLNGLVRPTGGRVSVHGIGRLDERGSLRAHRRQAAMVFQQHHLIGRLSVLDNVLIGRLGRYRALRTLWPWPRSDQEAALAAIDRVGLLDRALDRADRLSGGQQQRVGFARALVQQPRLVLADEPVASLDPATATALMAMLHAICKQDGLTAIVSLHQLELARQWADRIVGLKAGRVAFDGPPAALSAEVAHRLYSKDPSPEASHEPTHPHRHAPRGPEPHPAVLGAIAGR